MINDVLMSGTVLFAKADLFSWSVSQNGWKKCRWNKRIQISYIVMHPLRVVDDRGGSPPHAESCEGSDRCILTYPGRSVLLMITQKIEALGQHSEAKSIPNRNQSVFIHGVTSQGAGICRLFFVPPQGKRSEQDREKGRNRAGRWEKAAIPFLPDREMAKKPSKI